jgi:hypothetical protein
MILIGFFFCTVEITMTIGHGVITRQVFFRGTMYPDPRRIVVFYPSTPAAIPDPLKAFQAVKCGDDNLEEIYRFFNDLYAEDPYSGFEVINPFFASEENLSREQDARIIADAVDSLVVRSITQQNTIVIHVPDHVNLSKQTTFLAGTRSWPVRTVFDCLM